MNDTTRPAAWQALNGHAGKLALATAGEDVVAEVHVLVGVAVLVDAALPQGLAHVGLQGREAPGRGQDQERADERAHRRRTGSIAFSG